MTIKELVVVLAIMLAMTIGSIPLFNYIKENSPYQKEKTQIKEDTNNVSSAQELRISSPW